MESLIVIAVLTIGYWVYKKSKKEKHPIRIFEIKQALGLRAELLRHKAKDEYEADKLIQLAKDLEMLNSTDSLVKAEWSRARPGLINLTSSEMLTMLHLDSADRSDDYKAAIWDLIGKLDIKADCFKLRSD